MGGIISDSSLSSNPKFFNLVSLLKVGKIDAFWNLHHMWYWCSDHYPDGVMKNVSDVAIACSAQWPGDSKVFVDALVSSGFLDRKDGALIVHDWIQWRPEYVRSRDRRSTAKRPRFDRVSTAKEKREGPSSLPPNPPIPSSQEKKEGPVSSASLLKSKKLPTPFWRVLVDHIKRKWEFKKRPNGKFNPNAVDFKLLQGKARVYDAFELMALYDEFMAADDPFYFKKGHSIGMFCQAIDALVDKSGWKSRAEKYRGEHLKPVTEEEMVAVAEVAAVMTGMLNGKTQAIAR